ncbi:MAG: adenine-specific methyltransferase EcoRI family protein [Prevotellaceae bacterium]|jgi:hypothetical protein|nr:adenine-specific methyltransferase EcoRI family protein [Prevotellaceae bacterium]
MGNETLNAASKAKNDEFYTQISDISKECSHYKGHFEGKTIFCNCDDPYESDFFKYFALNFNHLGLKKLMASCYIGSPIANTQLSLFDYESAENKTTKSPHKIEITEMADENAGDMKGLPLVEYVLRNRKNALTRLQGDGDFRSPECVEMLKEADIVITNPPFSLFREYVAQLMEYKKRFLILGNMNALTYKEIFPLIKENKLWLGTDNGGTKWFQVPPHYDIKTETRIKIENGIKYFSMGSIMWFTNLDHKKRHEDIILFRQYTSKEYPKYDNYDAINVDKYIDIPVDYYGVMGVPVTFLDKYNPDQFEIVGNLGCYAPDGYSLIGAIYLNGKKLFKRIAIKRKD